MTAPPVRSRPTDAEKLGNRPLAPERRDDFLNRHDGNVSESRTHVNNEVAAGAQTSHTTGHHESGTIRGMARIVRQDFVRRLQAVRGELGLTPPAMARLLATERTTYLNWEAPTPAKPNFPSKEAVAAIRELIPGLTLDYLYLGKLEAMPLGLAIRLTARELGLDPDSQEGRQAAGAAVAARLS